MADTNTQTSANAIAADATTCGRAEDALIVEVTQALAHTLRADLDTRAIPGADGILHTVMPTLRYTAFVVVTRLRGGGISELVVRKCLCGDGFTLHGVPTANADTPLAGRP